LIVAQIAVIKSPSAEDVSAVQNGALWAYNVAQTGDDNLQRLVIHVHSGTGEMIGGLVGTYVWGWLHIESVILAESFRHQGIGTQLLKAAEEDAWQRGFYNIHLETMSFQARPFYERLGYEVFGVLPDYPPGHQQYFMRKTLKAP
jgi:ribosomal protein S18 acetylase RimI-like enzyme